MSALVVALSWLAYIYFIKPRRQYSTYVKALRSRGYKVLEIPFQPLHFPIYEKISEEESKGLGLRLFREIYPEYDAVVTNSFNKVMIDFIHPDFMKDFYNGEKHFSYPKSYGVVFPVMRMTFGGGLAFSEGSNWAYRRRILNRVMNFDLIINQIPKLANIS